MSVREIRANLGRVKEPKWLTRDIKEKIEREHNIEIFEKNGFRFTKVTPKKKTRNP